MREEPRRAGRVLVALTASSREPVTLEISRYLVGDAPPELLGLLVEDHRLLEHARSMLAREVVMSGVERRLDPVSLDRQLRARSSEVGRLFEAHALRLGLKHAFGVVRGEPLVELQRAAATADALVVDVAAAARAAPGAWPRHTLEQLALAPLPRVVFAREGWSTGTEVVLVAGAAADLAPAPGSPFGVALEVARRSRSPLRVLLVGEAAAAGALGTDLETAAHAAGVELKKPVAIAAVAGPGRAAALAAQTRRARLIVLAASQAGVAELVAELIARARAALLLARAV